MDLDLESHVAAVLDKRALWPARELDLIRDGSERGRKEGAREVTYRERPTQRQGTKTLAQIWGGSSQATAPHTEIQSQDEFGETDQSQDVLALDLMLV